MATWKYDRKNKTYYRGAISLPADRVNEDKAFYGLWFNRTEKEVDRELFQAYDRALAAGYDITNGAVAEATALPL